MADFSVTNVIHIPYTDALTQVKMVISKRAAAITTLLSL